MRSLRMFLALLALALPLHAVALQDAGGTDYSNTNPLPVTPRDTDGTSLVSGGLKSVIVDTSGDSAVDATANAVKTVVVDSAGAALVGGRGSRVELLASGTSTTAAGATHVLVSSTGGGGATIADIPAWCHTIQFTAVITAFTGAPTNFYVYYGPLFPNSAAIGAVWITSVTVASPTAGTSGGALYVGREVQTLGVSSITPVGGGGAIVATAGMLGRRYAIGRAFTVAPATVAIPWELYCIGG